MGKIEFITRIQVNGVKEEVPDKGGRGTSMRKIWIIRFSDGTIGSCYGTRSGATEIAELRKEDYGGSYTIEGEEQ